MGNPCSVCRSSIRRRRRAKRLQERAERLHTRNRRADGLLPEDDSLSVANSMFVLDNPGDFLDFYDMDERLGEGSFARVCLCSNLSTGAQRAVKICQIARKTVRGMFYEELDIIKLLDHPNIVRLYEHFEDERYLYMVLELCAGGQLFDLLLKLGHFTESQTAIIVHQILLGVRHMHDSRSVCHRDLKIENILLHSKEPVELNRVKICDFGLSKVFKRGEYMTTKCGSPYFISPQMIAGKYDQSCDLWAIGVVMYALLCGYPPFHGESDAEVISRARAGVYKFSAADWANVSEDAKDVIRGLLRMDAKQRLTASSALQKPWFRRKITQKVASPLKLAYFGNLMAFGRMSTLKKATLLAVANSLDEEYTKPLVDTFMWLDTSGEGSINVAELHEGVRKAGFDVDKVPFDRQEAALALERDREQEASLREALKAAEEEPANQEAQQAKAELTARLDALARGDLLYYGLLHMMVNADIDAYGDLNYTEFVAGTLDERVYTREEVVWDAFRVFDRRGVGRIGPGDLRELWGSTVSRDKCKQIIAEVARSIEAETAKWIDFEGFTAMMEGRKIPRKPQEPEKKQRGRRASRRGEKAPKQEPIQERATLLQLAKLEQGGATE